MDMIMTYNNDVISTIQAIIHLSPLSPLPSSMANQPAVTTLYSCILL